MRPMKTRTLGTSGATAPPTPHLRIGELARISGRSVHTIRWYEAKGLMPGAARDAGGRRVFTQAHVDWLELMDRLRQSGMSIRQMQGYARQVRAGKATLGARQLLLLEHRARVEQQVQELQLSLQLIDRKVALYGQWIRKHGAGGAPAP